ncbi:hypothetical protein [Stappia sp. ES.058]|uniref:hypothetical protein n=1 Tax=Stappia sp. ES.058 TaxID=1881061 RepID=UPI0012FD0663|nr:hypothetical protein [Stappia sp. ES.058]
MSDFLHTANDQVSCRLRKRNVGMIGDLDHLCRAATGDFSGAFAAQQKSLIVQMVNPWLTASFGISEMPVDFAD